MNRNTLDKYPGLRNFDPKKTLNGLKLFIQIPRTQNALIYKLIRLTKGAPVSMTPYMKQQRIKGFSKDPVQFEEVQKPVSIRDKVIKEEEENG